MLLRKNGVPYPVISEILGRGKEACIQKASSRGYGFATSKSKEEKLEDLKRIAEPFKKIPPLSKGKIAEDIVAIEFTKRGFDIFVPYTPQHQTDLIAVKGNKIAKLQVKSAVWDERDNRFRVPLMRKHSISNTRKFYDPNDIDFFIFVCLGIEITYVAPYELCYTKKEAHLYPHRTKATLNKTFDWEEYSGRFDLISEFLDKWT